VADDARCLKTKERIYDQTEQTCIVTQHVGTARKHSTLTRGKASVESTPSAFHSLSLVQ
jgi:hypothetical protein